MIVILLIIRYCLIMIISKLPKVNLSKHLLCLFRFSTIKNMASLPYLSDPGPLITKTHGRVRVDEYANINPHLNEMETFIEGENRIFEKHSKKWEDRLQSYVQQVNQRRD